MSTKIEQSKEMEHRIEALFDFLVEADDQGVTFHEIREHLNISASSVPAVIAGLREELSDRNGKPYVYQDGRYFLTGREKAPLVYVERRLRAMRTSNRRTLNGTTQRSLAIRPDDLDLRFLAKTQKRLDEDLTESIEMLQAKIARTA